MLVVARYELIPPPLDEEQPAVLLEGAWPPEVSSRIRTSLDDAIDARFAWIDADASRLAGAVAESTRGAGPPSLDEASPGWLNALALRYYLVKLIRPIVYFTEVRPLNPGDCVTALLCRGGDEDYRDILEQLCLQSGADCQFRWIDRLERGEEKLPSGGRWRRWLDVLRRPLEPRADWADPRRRIVLCGNPRILQPVCRELVSRDCAVWWLYDRLALKAWLRWRRLGVGQLVCDSEVGRENRFRAPAIDFCAYRGVDLSQIVERWISRRLAVHGTRHSRLLGQMDSHFGQVRPDALVLDEDATPTARAAVAVAHRHHVRSFVVQHGAPVCRFGFAPLAADRMLAWGPSSQQQFEAWGIAPARVLATGSPVHDELLCRLSGSRQAGRSRLPSGTFDARSRSARGTYSSPASEPRLNILLLATTPPRDERPDSVAFHLTGSTYTAMLRAAFAAVSKLPRARLIVKLHPRCPHDPVMERVAGEFPSVETEFVASGPLEPHLANADCALSCASSAGIDAALAGVPVVQLLPAGSADILPAERWGLIGSARSEAELDMLLERALAAGRKSEVQPNPLVFRHAGNSAAAVADAVISAGMPNRMSHRKLTPEHFAARTRRSSVERAPGD